MSNQGTMFALFAALALAAPAAARSADPVRLRIGVSGDGAGSLPCRIHLLGPDGDPVRPEGGLPFWADHFVCPGTAAVRVAPGAYQLEIERGPAWSREKLALDVTPGAAAHGVDVELRRLVDPAALGWFDADLHVHRPQEEIALHLAAEDLQFAPVTTWWNDQNLWAEREVPDRSTIRGTTPDGRHFDLMAGEDERGGGALLYFGLDRPLAIGGAEREAPSSVEFADTARSLQPGVHIDAEKPFWWDFPVWVGNGAVDTVGIAHNHLHRSGVLANEAWGRPRDTSRHPGPHGNGRWTLEIYDRLLDAGIRLPPSAGSASGVLPNPVGYNRVYVHLGAGADFDPHTWWESLRAGRSFVTNGPLLFASAGGELPGHVFQLGEGNGKAEPLELELNLRVVSNDPLRELYLTRGQGEIEALPFDPESLDQTVSVTIPVQEAGWFAVRAVADVDETFRFASTAPFYVDDSEGHPAQPKTEAVEFFQRWLQERRTALEAILGSADRDRILRFHTTAARDWQARRELAREPEGR